MAGRVCRRFVFRGARIGAAAAESTQERRKWLGQAVGAVEEAAKIYRNLNLPADLAMSLWGSANVYQALAQAEEDEEKERAHRLRAAESIDEAILLFEQTGQKYYLVQAYPHGVQVHFPLLSERPESVEKIREYAAKAGPPLACNAKTQMTFENGT